MKNNSIFVKKESDMKPDEILRILKEGGNFEMKHSETGWHGHGAINNFPECSLDTGITMEQYRVIYSKSKI